MYAYNFRTCVDYKQEIFKNIYRHEESLAKVYLIAYDKNNQLEKL